MSLDEVCEAEGEEDKGHYHHQDEGHAHHNQGYCVGGDVGGVSGCVQRGVGGQAGESGEVQSDDRPCAENIKAVSCSDLQEEKATYYKIFIVTHGIFIPEH